jgi:trehalose 6-phosphate synthase/phosphatase
MFLVAGGRRCSRIYEVIMRASRAARAGRRTVADGPDVSEVPPRARRAGGRINGAFGTARWTPVHCLYRSVPEPQLLALYRAAHVMLVTQAFVGTADELTDAVLVNPYDVEGAADAHLRAPTMSREERQSRMRALRARVQAYDVHGRAESFLTALDGTSEPRDGAGVAASVRAP